MSKLKDCVDILDSKRIPLSSKIRSNLSKIYPYYGAQGIVDYVDDYLFDGSYILVAEDGNNLKSLKEPITTWATGKFWVNNHAHILGEKEGYCLKYIYYLLTSMDLRGYITGSAQPKFNQENLANIEIELPNRTIQEKIATMLAVLDEKILNNKHICLELESMAQTLYDYWFTQFDFPNEEGKPYRSSGGKMVWNEQLKREIPKEWSVQNIENSCDIIDCLHSQKPDKVYKKEDLYLLQLENLVDLGLIDLNKKYYVDEDMYKLWTNKIEVSNGDLVVTNAGRIGSVSRISSYVKSGIGRNMTAIRPQTIPAFFLYYFFKSPDFAVQVKTNTDSGAFFGSLNVRGIKQLLLTLPDKDFDILERFDKIAEPMRRKIELLHQENQELTKLRDWLLPMLMNGQVTVE